MNYIQIVDAAIAYSMRSDSETRAMMNVFIQIVESRLNRALSVGQMFNRAEIAVKEGQSYYGLPEGFLSLRDVQIKGRDTLRYVTPEVMNSAISQKKSEYIHTLVANQLQIHPVCVGDTLEVIYRSRLKPLNDSNEENWLSVMSPDLYIFGLLVEISAFAKDGEAGEIWNSRFNSAMASLQNDDDTNRWSSPTLSISTG